MYVATYKNYIAVFRIHHRSGMNFEQNAPKPAQMLTFQPARAQPTYKVLGVIVGANRRTVVEIKVKTVTRTRYIGAKDREYETREEAARSIIVSWFESVMDEWTACHETDTAAAANEMTDRAAELGGLIAEYLADDNTA